MSVADDQLVPRVRVMRHEDVDEVARIESQSYRFPWSLGIFRDCLLAGYHCLVVDQQVEVRAYSVLSMAAGEAHILNVCVAPAFRRRGYGMLLLNEMIQVARESRIRRIFLEVRPSNLAATSMYHALGFTTIGRRSNYYRADNNGREDALVLSLAL
ncbi:MAG: ribosomal protein S18-alanine N-acetyltransferase [Pseudomonadota bacterium]